MSKWMWNAGLAVLALAFLGLLAGFASTAVHIRKLAGELEPAHPEEPQRRRVALISQELDNPFWRSVESGARASAGRYGMTIEYGGPRRIDPQEQSRLLEKAIAERFDAVLVQGLNEPSYAALIDRASAQGIPVITVDADEPNSARIAYVGTDNKLAGERMGRLVAQTIGGTGRIGVVLGSEAVNQKLRLEGFRSVIDRYPGLAVADVRISNISRLQAAKEAEDMLRERPGLRAIVGFSALDGPGIAEAVQRQQAASPAVFAFDDLESTRQEIRQCRIKATLVQNPVEMGEEAVALLHAYFQGERIGKVHYTGTTVLDRSALADDGGASGADCR